MTRLIILTGAPQRSTLQWDEDLVSQQGNIDGTAAAHLTVSPESSSVYSAQWRQIPVKAFDHDTDRHNASPVRLTIPDQAAFLSTAELTQQTASQPISTLSSTSISTASMRTAAGSLDDFYDHSLALQEDDLTTSQLSVFQSQTTSPDDTKGFRETTQAEPSGSIDHGQTVLPFHISTQHLKDIKDIPSAAYLHGIEPQTMTVNLIVGIMALPPLRTVITGRRWRRQREMQLLEVLVGDDTRAGFEITMWLPNDDDTSESRAHGASLRSQTQRLRPHDIVFLRNVALCAYQGRVHGQSLRRGVTKVDLLYRRQPCSSNTGAIYSSKDLLDPAGNDLVLNKARRVRQWLIHFVGNDMSDNLEEGSRIIQRVLPPDTQ